MKKFILGLTIGMVGGGLLVANNCKLRSLVKRNQDDMVKRAEKYIDERLAELDKKQHSSCCSHESCAESEATD